LRKCPSVRAWKLNWLPKSRLVTVLFNTSAAGWRKGHATIRADLELRILQPAVGLAFQRQEAGAAREIVLDPTWSNCEQN
jgi:hypothetical protein